ESQRCEGNGRRIAGSCFEGRRVRLTRRVRLADVMWTAARAPARTSGTMSSCCIRIQIIQARAALCGGTGRSRTFVARYGCRTALARAEGDDAPDRIVGRDAHGHAISRNNFDTEAAHSAAELGQHFMAGVALNPIEAPAVDSHDRALHVDEIV